MYLETNRTRSNWHDAQSKFVEPLVRVILEKNLSRFRSSFRAPQRCEIFIGRVFRSWRFQFQSQYRRNARNCIPDRIQIASWTKATKHLWNISSKRKSKLTWVSFARPTSLGRRFPPLSHFPGQELELMNVLRNVKSGAHRTITTRRMEKVWAAGAWETAIPSVSWNNEPVVGKWSVAYHGNYCYSVCQTAACQT